MKRGICGLLAALLLALPVGVRGAWANPYGDVAEEDWYWEAVAYVHEAGLFYGTAEDAFSPQQPMSRGMFVTVLGKFAQAEEGGAAEFSDVSPEDYFAPWVAWAAEAGVVQGIGGGRFGPELSVTREQMAVMLYHYAWITGCDTSREEGAANRFPDGASVSSWARQAVDWAVTQGVLRGMDGRLAPQGTATRAQTAQIFYNSRELLATQVQEPAPPPEEEPEPPVEEPQPPEVEPPVEEPPVMKEDPAWVNGFRSRLEGGSNHLTQYGVTRAALLRELTAHEGDGYYLGTPYRGGDYQSPNGDTSYNRRAGMNCGGFVSYVLRKAGLDAARTQRVMRRTSCNLFGSGRAYDLLAGASNYENWVENGELEAYVFGWKENLLASGKAEKGDILLMLKGPAASAREDNHIGFFWGDSPDQDLLWHSGSRPGSGNQIGPITPMASQPVYILIKIE